MGSFRLSQDFIDKIENECKKKAKNLAHEASEKLTAHYKSLLDWYYDDYEPKVDKNGNPYYVRTFNLYKSAHKYYKNNMDKFYGGVRIDGSTMRDYPGVRGISISGQRLLDKFIYAPTLPSATWHGGDWHGGYGEMASFSVYDEMQKYKDKLVEDLQGRCKI